MIITADIPGNPIAKKRPRFARRGKFVQTYNEQETEEGLFLARFMNTAKIENPLIGPLQIECIFHIKRPKGHYGTGKNQGILKKTSPIHHTSTPDVDNLLKFVCDSLNGYAWVDDSQIVIKYGEKVYAVDYPKTEITIEEIL